MATGIEKLIGKKGTHAVGFFSSVIKPRTIEGGAKAAVDMDNFTLVEMYFDPADDETPIIKPLTDKAKKGLILYNPEVLHFEAFETKMDYFVGKDEMAKVYYQEPIVTFKVSNFKVVDAGKTVADVKRGWVAYYDIAEKTYCLTATEPTDKGVNLYDVFSIETEDVYAYEGLDMVELQIRA